MKKVLLLGATGTLGRALADRMVSDTDHEITLFSRHSSKLKIKGNVRLVEGDAAKESDLSAAMEGQDVIVCVISGYQLPDIAKNLVSCMDKLGNKRLIFTGAVGIYDEIPAGNGEQYNVSNEPPQVPNRKAVDILEASDLSYTILRPGFLRDGAEDDYVLTMKGEAAKGYMTTIPSLIKLIEKLIEDDDLYVRESVSITKNMA